MDNYLIWGGGGHGKVVADVARSAGLPVAGFIDTDSSKLNKVVAPGGIKVTLSETEFLASAKAGSLPPEIEGILLAIGANADRARCRAQLDSRLVATAVHGSAVVDPSVEIGPGTVVMATSVINADTVIGAGVIVNTGAIIEHDCVIGDDSHIAPGSVLAGGVKIGARVLVGAGSVIIPGVAVGDDVTIGAGSVVLQDLAPKSRVAGNPAKEIKS